VITIEVNGANWEGFLSAEVFLSMEAVSGAFSFEFTAKPGVPFPLKKNANCKVFVDGNLVITGTIEKIEPNWSDTSHTIRVSGRDRISDLVDSTVGDIKDIKTPMTFETMCRIVLDGMGLSDLKVINQAGTIQGFDESEKITAEVGVTGFAFLEGYARKRQVLLTSDGDSNLVIARNSNIVLKTKILNVIDGKDNNVKAGSGASDDSKRFYKYIVRSQANPSAVGFEGAESSVSDISGEAVDNDIRKSRVLEIVAEQSMDAETCQKRAQWEANIRRARSTSASYTIPGHSASGELWQPNRLTDVVDQFNDISARMLIKDIRFRQSLNGGSLSMLSVVPPEAFTLLASQPGTQKKNDDIFAAFTQEQQQTTEITPLDVKIKL
jgi:prophage tail gpP-like protein